jgi:hypothetical protein
MAGGLLATLLAACGSAVGPGPFGNPGKSDVSQCAPVPPNGVLSYAVEEFSNGGRQTAVITSVALVKPQNLRVLAAYVVPITGHYLIGVMPGFPPSHLGPGVQWSHRQRAVGARIPPSGRDVVTNLLLVLKPATMTGSAQGVQVSYEVSGQEYIWQTSTAVTVKVTTSC